MGRSLIKYLKRKLGITALEERVELLEHKIDTLYGNSHVGVDVGYGRDDSWAVICIQGKRDFVSFQRLQHKEIVEIQRFLRQFERSKGMCVDTPFPNMFEGL